MPLYNISPPKGFNSERPYLDYTNDERHDIWINVRFNFRKKVVSKIQLENQEECVSNDEPISESGSPWIKDFISINFIVCLYLFY